MFQKFPAGFYFFSRSSINDFKEAYLLGFPAPAVSFCHKFFTFAFLLQEC